MLINKICAYCGIKETSKEKGEAAQRQFRNAGWKSGEMGEMCPDCVIDKKGSHP